MPRDLSHDEVSQFARDGVLRLEGLIDPRCASLALQAVLRPLERIGLYRDGAWRLTGRQRPEWPATGLKARDIGNRHAEVEALVELPAVRGVVGRLLDGKAVDRKVFPRPQVLATLPNRNRWVLPDSWHTDVPRLASGRSPGVQLFMFLDGVAAGGGGTVVLAGSHRLLNDGRNLRPKEIVGALRPEPFSRPCSADVFKSRGRMRCRPAVCARPICRWWSWSASPAMRGLWTCACCTPPRPTHRTGPA